MIHSHTWIQHMKPTRSRRASTKPGSIASIRYGRRNNDLLSHLDTTREANEVEEGKCMGRRTGIVFGSCGCLGGGEFIPGYIEYLHGKHQQEPCLEHVIVLAVYKKGVVAKRAGPQHPYHAMPCTVAAE